MLIGVDWEGTKIEAVAMTPEGEDLLRLRRATIMRAASRPSRPWWGNWRRKPASAAA